MRTPMLLVWMSNFGASLSSPAMPFFYLGLGLSFCLGLQLPL